MVKDSGMEMTSLRVDGGPTRDEYLMQFQSDILGIPLLIPQTEELSGMGAAYAAGIAAGIYDKESIFAGMQRKEFKPQMAAAEREKRCNGWKKAVKAVLEVRD
jgi:glycerol kinase